MRANEKLVIKRTSPRLTSGHKGSQKLDAVRDEAIPSPGEKGQAASGLKETFRIFVYMYRDIQDIRKVVSIFVQTISFKLGKCYIKLGTRKHTHAHGEQQDSKHGKMPRTSVVIIAIIIWAKTIFDGVRSFRFRTFDFILLTCIYNYA